MSRVLAAFSHRVLSENTFGDTTIIDHPMTNNQPDTVLLITNIAIPGPGGAVSGNAHPVAAAYISSANTGIPAKFRKRWSIWNVDQKPMPMKTVFNVIVVKP